MRMMPISPIKEKSMTSAAFHVTAIGNALVDIIAEATDDFLQAQKITKNAMTLIDSQRAEALYAALGPAVEMSGGSAANTVAGIASLGGKAAFMGKVKADQLGEIFRHDLQSQGVHFATKPSQETDTPTGRCMIVVTPDAHRSMSTFLGAAVEFGPADIDATTLQNSQVTYLEGYLFDPPEAKKAFYRAADIVRQSGRQLALTLSDTFCVERYRAEFLAFIKKDVDILFANQSELLALYETQAFDKAIEAARADCKIAVTTRSEKGAIVVSGKDTVEIAAVPVAKLVDTTGAGDLFAAGFLYGLTHNKSLAESGRIGAIAAAEVISHYGPRPQKTLKDLIG
jgi:sugar/nucleoside kinase (ribokinase family)